MERSLSSSILSLAVALLVAVGGGAGPLVAQDVVILEEDEEEVDPQEELGVDWPERIAAIDRQLRAGQWSGAASAAAELGDEMAALLSFQGGSDYALATVLAYRALAAAGQGQREEARWHWLTALNLWDDYHDADLTAYGRAGELLTGVRLREGRNDLQRSGRDVEVLTLDEVDRPAMRRGGDIPPYPAFLEMSGIEGSVVVEAIVDADGRMREPLVVESEGPPAFLYTTLQTLRDWRYEPARKGDEAVAVFQYFRFVFELEE